MISTLHRLEQVHAFPGVAHADLLQCLVFITTLLHVFSVDIIIHVGPAAILLITQLRLQFLSKETKITIVYSSHIPGFFLQQNDRAPRHAPFKLRPFTL